MKAAAQKSDLFAACALALSLATTACVSPMASQATQASPLRKGDSFSIVSPAAEGHPLQAMDALVLKELAARTGASATGQQWLVEYSYAVRPAAIALKTDSPDAGLREPQSDAILVCRETSHRVTVRILDKNEGKQSYRSSAELTGCRADLTMDEAIFNSLLNSALDSLKIN